MKQHWIYSAETVAILLREALRHADPSRLSVIGDGRPDDGRMLVTVDGQADLVAVAENLIAGFLGKRPPVFHRDEDEDLSRDVSDRERGALVELQKLE